jgi:hypothetical protein
MTLAATLVIFALLVATGVFAASAQGRPAELIVHLTVPGGDAPAGRFNDPFGHLWLVGDKSPLRRAPG